MSLRMGFAIMQRGDRMTNELAIRILTGDVLGTASQTSEAIKMAVKALSLPSAQPDLTYIIFETLAECGIYGEEATIKLIGTLKRLGRNDLLPPCVR